MDDDAKAWMLGAQVLDLPDRETRVDRAVPFPQDDPRAPDGVGLEAAPDFVRIPDDHVVERYAELVRRVAPKMLIGQEQNALAALPRPAKRRGGIRRRADDAAALVAERFDRRRGVDVGDRHDARAAVRLKPRAARDDAHLLEIAPAHLEL